MSFGKDIRSYALKLFNHQFFKHFGLNPVLYLQVFKDYNTSEKIGDSKSNKEWIQLSKFDDEVLKALSEYDESNNFENYNTTNKYNDPYVKKFLRDSLGYGYILVGIVGKTIYFKEMTQDFYENDSNFNIDKMEINYPCKLAKLITMRINNKFYKITISFRSTNGSIYPGDMSIFYSIKNMVNYFNH